MTVDMPVQQPKRPPLRQALRSALVWALWMLGAYAVTQLGALFMYPGGAILNLPLLALFLVPAGLLPRWPFLGLPVMLLIGLCTAALELFRPWDFLILELLVLQVAIGYVAAHHRPRVSVPAAVLVVVTESAATFLPGHLPTGTQPVREMLTGFFLMAGASAWIIGNSVRQRRAYADVRREQAVNAERLRIARELHDMISHSVGVIAIQAGMGARVIETQPAEAGAALRTIEATSRDTLAQLRRTLGSLRRAEAAPAEFDPAPGLADLDRLVASTADGGVRVDLRVHGEAGPVPPDIDLSAYRIIQEALTNVVRHAGVDTCRVDVTYRTEELLIEITDEGAGVPVPGAGYGIAGMRERVDMLHGEFSAGPRAGGGFAVRARLLLPTP